MARKATMQDDPNVKLPGAVQRSISRSDEIHKQVYGGKNPPANKEGDPDPAGKTNDPTPAPEGTTQASPPAPPADPKPSSAPAPTASQPTPAPEPTPGNNEEDAKVWRGRYMSMKGRFEQQEQRLAQAAARIEGLEQVLSQANNMPPQQQPPAQPQMMVTDEEKERYGAEFLDVVRRQAAQTYDPIINELKQTIQDLNKKLGNVDQNITKNARGQMFELLDTRVPDWREMNDNPDFLAWLGLPDRFSGVTRAELIAKADEANDGERVAAFFEGFKSEQAAPAPTTENPAPADPQPTTARPRLEDIAAPGRAGNAGGNYSQPPAEGKPTFTPAEIAQFYNDVRRGLYEGRDEERSRVDRAIIEAGREGRILQQTTQIRV